MVRRAWAWSACLVVASGCVPQETTLPIVSDNPFLKQPADTALKAFHAPATEAVALRVNEVGQRILAANKDLPVKPAFQTIGSPTLELFHRGGSVIFVSEALVNRCPSDAQLSAVLCQELGRMMSQHEALAAIKARRPDRDPPVAMPVGSDSGGVFGAADAVRLAELAKQDQGRRPVGPPPPPPDPQLLARMYLTRSGYIAADLDAVAPLLREAEQNSTLEKQLTNAPIPPWPVKNDR
jgi:hypothetical protein